MLPQPSVVLVLEAYDAFAPAGRVDHWADGYDPDTGELGQDHQVWELACAELCGWGHYKMRGKLFVHKDEADYQRWLAAAKARQNSTRPAEE